MTIKFNVPGSKRKELVKTISVWLEEDIKYCGAPGFAYEVGYFTIDRDGGLSFDDSADSEVIERLLEHLCDEGFECDISAEQAEETTEAEEITHLDVSVPENTLDGTAMQNLEALIAAKGNLLKKALGADELPVLKLKGEIHFPWFDISSSPEEAQTYAKLIEKLIEMAKNAKRVTAKEKETDNDKYAFRCFLLRLGFIGDEYKADRKTLLKNLTGSSAFKSAKAKEAE